MKARNKSLLFLLFALICSIFCLAATACEDIEGGDDNGDVNPPAATWEYDDNQHWQGDSAKENHVFSDAQITPRTV